MESYLFSAFACSEIVRDCEKQFINNVFLEHFQHLLKCLTHILLEDLPLDHITATNFRNSQPCIRIPAGHGQT